MRLFPGALVLAYPSISFADCTPTEAPELPSGETSDMAAMVEGQKTVKAYMAATEEYLGCLTAEAAGEEVSEEQGAKDVETHNAAVDEMEAVAAKFNEEIRAYKAKSQQSTAPPRRIARADPALWLNPPCVRIDVDFSYCAFYPTYTRRGLKLRP